jgi:hypothetical protein
MVAADQHYNLRAPPVVETHSDEQENDESDAASVPHAPRRTPNLSPQDFKVPHNSSIE